MLGDALAVVLSRVKNYNREDYGLHHPAGALGKKLLVHVQDIMYTGDDDATVYEGSSLHEAIIEMSQKGLSMVSIVDRQEHLKGIITDGDLRRMLEKGVDIYAETVDHVMTVNPKWIDAREMAVNALQRMSDLRITGMPVLNEEQQVIGTHELQLIQTGVTGRKGEIKVLCFFCNREGLLPTGIQLISRRGFGFCDLIGSKGENLIGRIVAFCICCKFTADFTGLRKREAFNLDRMRGFVDNLELCREICVALWNRSGNGVCLIQGDGSIECVVGRFIDTEVSYAHILNIL